MSDRKPISPEIQTQILTSSARRCCICFGLNKDFTEKKGQIAHLDQNPANPNIENLAWLCFDHHDQYDGQTRQSKNLTIGEVKHYRELLHQAVTAWRENKSTATTHPKSDEIRFNAGSRIKKIREELGLKTSQFAELLSYPSQREYEEMETGQKDVPLNVLYKIKELCGANLEWLKHEEKQAYEVDYLHFNPVKDALIKIANLKPQKIFLTADISDPHHVGFVIQTNEFLYQALDTEITLDFGHWVERHWIAPLFYEFLDGLSNNSFGIEGVLLPSKYDKDLYEGHIHFLTAYKYSNIYGRDLAYDILDIDEKRLKPFLTYKKAYGGNWMNEAHKGYKKILAAIDLDNEFENKLIENITKASEQGFNSQYIQDELAHNGGVFAVKRLLYRDKGIPELKELKRLEILQYSMEALVIQEKFHSLFRADEIKKAKQRLSEVGYH